MKFEIEKDIPVYDYRDNYSESDLIRDLLVKMERRINTKINTHFENHKILLIQLLYNKIKSNHCIINYILFFDYINI